jgi:ribA/ribD-fused uncharacterized protein
MRKKGLNLPTRIDYFKYEWAFLSNFYPSEVTFEGVLYASVEHAYQAAKFTDPEIRSKFAVKTNPRLTPGQAKRLAHSLRDKGLQRPDWDEISLTVMRGLLVQKFSGSILKRKLLSTFSAYLEEGNYWHDTFYGVCHGKIDGMVCKRISEHKTPDTGYGDMQVDPDTLVLIGQNHLGRLLMEIRSEIAGLDKPAPAGAPAPAEL